MKTLGDLLKKKRLDEEIKVEKVCEDLNIWSSTLHRWENNLTSPRWWSRDKLMAYLGNKYLKLINESLPKQKGPKTLGDLLRKKRQDEHLMASEMCSDLGIWKSTLYHWENNVTSPEGELRDRVLVYLGDEYLRLMKT